MTLLWTCGLWYRRSGCFCPAVPMVNTADSRLDWVWLVSGQTYVDRPTARCALIQRDVCSVFVIIRQILTTKPSEVVTHRSDFENRR